MYKHALALLASLALCSGAQAQSYPSKAVHIVVPLAAGGAADTIARAVAQRLAEAWNQQVLIENKAGANTQIGAQQVAKSAPDGYTLLASAETTFVVNPSLYSKLSYDPAKDFAPISGLGIINQALIVHPSVTATTVKELIGLAKAKPGELTYGTFGIGSSGHLNMEMFQGMAGVMLRPVHYRGGAPGSRPMASPPTATTSSARWRSLGRPARCARSRSAAASAWLNSRNCPPWPRAGCPTSKPPPGSGS